MSLNSVTPSVYTRLVHPSSTTLWRERIWQILSRENEKSSITLETAKLLGSITIVGISALDFSYGDESTVPVRCFILANTALHEFIDYTLEQSILANGSNLEREQIIIKSSFLQKSGISEDELLQFNRTARTSV